MRLNSVFPLFIVLTFVLTADGQERRSKQPNVLLVQKVEVTLGTSPLLEPNDAIDVQAWGDDVTLTGVVSSWEEHRLATELAFKAGAEEVYNKLTVRNAPFESNKTFHYSDIAEVGNEPIDEQLDG